MRILRFRDGCELIHRHHKPILIVAALATIVGGYLTSKLGLQSDLAELLPDHYESVRALDRVREEVGGTGNMRIVLDTRDFPSAVRFAKAVEPELLASSYVLDVDLERDVAFYEKNALLYLDTLQLDSLHTAIEDAIEAERQEINPFVVDDLFGDAEEEEETGTSELEEWEERYRENLPREYYMNEDSTVLVMLVYPAAGRTNLAYNRAMREEVGRIIDEAGPERYDATLEILYGGNIQNSIDEYEGVRRDILGTAVYGVTAVFLVIAIYFRSIPAAFMIAISLAGSLMWTFGLTFLVIGQLNTITGFLFVILFGLGIDYGIHSFARFREARQEGRPSVEALHDMVCKTGAALGTTALTTAAAFYSLMLMDFRGFSELGFIAGTGMLFAFIGMVVVLPALTLFLDNLGLLRIPPRPERAERAHVRSRLAFAPGTLAVGALLILLAAYGITRVTFQYDFTNLRSVTPEREAVAERIEGVFDRSESPAIILTDSRAEMREVMDSVRVLRDRDTLSPTFERIGSVLAAVPDDQPRRLEKIRDLRVLVDAEADNVSGEDERRLNELRSYLSVEEPFTIEDVPPSDRRRLLKKNGEIGDFVLIYPSVPLRDGRNSIAFSSDIGEVTIGSGKTLHAASSNIIMAEMLTMITREGRLAVGLSLLVVLLIVTLQFRSLRRGALVVSPLVIGLLGMGGAMAVFGLQLNIFNLVVLPSIVGIGVDSGVHVYHRYLGEGPRSLPLVLRRTGLAVTMATLTTMVGYSGLLTASHPGLVSIGKLAIVGLATTLISAVVLFPAALQVLEDRATAAAVAASPATPTEPEATAAGPEVTAAGDVERPPTPSRDIV
jgi:predicted RND superfamily exporter protein